MIKKSIRTSLFSLGISFTIIGCGTTQNVAVPDMTKPIPQDKSIIELERSSSFTGVGRNPYVYSNDKLIGELASDGKLIWLTDSNQLECVHVESTQFPIFLGGTLVLDDRPISYKCYTTRAGEIIKLEMDFKLESFVNRPDIAKKTLEKELKDTFIISNIFNNTKSDTQNDIVTLLKNSIEKELDTKLVSKDAKKLVELYIEEYQEGNAVKRWVAVTKEGSTLLKVKTIVRENNQIIDTYIIRLAIVEGGLASVGADKLIFDYVGKDISKYLLNK